MSDNTVKIRRSPTAEEVVVQLQPVKQEEKYPTEHVPLPTKGHFYPLDHLLSIGTIEIKQMTAREEDVLANQELLRKGTVLDVLLSSLIVDKSINVKDILIVDKNAIMIAIRRLAYGDDYPISVSCPQCDVKNQVVINLGNIENKPFDLEGVQKGENSFAFKLPNSKKTITYKLLNQHDDDSITTELNNQKKISKDAPSRELTTRLKYLITSVDGTTDKAYIRKFVDEELMANDSLALRTHFRDHNPDIDMSFDFTCHQCSYERRLGIPLGMSFLWPGVDDGR